MSESRDCASFLGCYIAEEVLSHYFNGIQKMPYGNEGYDFVCSKGFKIDVKSACLTNSLTGQYPRWFFNIERNLTPDYFLILAFDDRENLNPLHIWLIPGNKINQLKSLSISPGKVDKFNQYENLLIKFLQSANNLRRVLMVKSKNDFEWTMVQSLNSFFKSGDRTGKAYRLKQTRYQSQFLDILVDSKDTRYYLGIECKSINAVKYKKLYWATYFSQAGGVHQLDRIAKFLHETGRKGFLAVELRNGPGHKERPICCPSPGFMISISLG